jgi:hypothetical protein
VRQSCARHRLLTGVTSMWYARPPIVSSKRRGLFKGSPVTCVDVRGKWSGLQFYAVAARDQAKRVAKTVQQRRASGVFGGSAQKKILRVRFSTGYALSVHRFSTHQRQGSGQTQVKCCIA